MQLKLRVVKRGGSLALHLAKELNDQLLRYQEGDIVDAELEPRNDAQQVKRKAQTPDDPEPPKPVRKAQTPPEE